MSILRSMATPGQRRGWMQKTVGMAAWAVGGWAAFKLPATLPPGIGLLTIAGIVSVVIVALTRFNPAEAAGPSQRNVQFVTAAVVGGTAWTVLTACTALSHGLDPVSRPVLVMLTVVAVSMIAVTAWARLRNSHPTALPVTIGDAVDAVTDGGRVQATLLAATLLAGVASLAYAGFALAPTVVLLAVLIPVKLGWKAAKVRAGTRVEFSGAFCGLLAGGAWTKPLEDNGSSPITCRWDDDRDAPTRDAPTRIAMPLPPKWASTGTEALENEVAARLVEHGEYVVRVELGSKRRLTATLVMPLPEILAYDGRPAANGTIVWLGTGKATREHNAAPGSKGKANGELLDVTWNLRSEPHGLAVGTTGGGKTQTVSLIMIQLALAGWKLVLLDPKRVEFTAWEGRPGVLKVATELPDMVESLVAARAEMERRYEEMRQAGVNHIDLLPAGADRPPRLLIVVDEVVELLGKTTGKSDEAKEINELKEQAGEAIGSILQLGRAAGVHLLACGQRVERALFSGSWQNNIACKILHGRPDLVERTMIGINDVLATPGVPGRAVMRSLALPQTETQIAYVDLQQLDRWLPVGGADPGVPVVKLSPEDLVPLRLTTVVHAPTPKPVPAPKASTKQDRDGDDGQDGPRFTFNRQEPLPKGEAMDALEAMIGLDGVKAQVRQLQAIVQAAAARRGRRLGGKEAPAPNLLFVGPPGTGKTVTARIFASMLHDLGALKTGQLIEADRSSLVGAWVGHTALKVDAAFEAASGGCLFIDEAYSLVDGGSGGFGAEAIAAILKRAEDRRGEVVVIMAGYPHEMDTLLDANPGLRSRFPDSGRISFDAYDNDELAEIYAAMVAGADRMLMDDAMDAITEVIADAPRDDDWGNARSVRGMVESACARADVRLHASGFEAASDLDLMTLTAEDVRGEGTVSSPPVQDQPQDDDILEDEVVDDVDDAPDVDDAAGAAVDADVDWIGDAVEELLAKGTEADVPA